MAEAKIFSAINGVMRDVGAVSKDKTNDQQRYKFRGIDDVMNALYPAMVKNNVFVTPTVLDVQREERTNKNGNTLIYSILTIRYTFFTTDGSSVECVVVGEAMDSGDKSMNKALSAGLKYAFFQTFCIPTEEMHDSEENTYEVTAERKQAKTPTKTNSKASNLKEEQKSDEQKDAELKAKATEDPDVLVVEQGGSPVDKKRARVKAELERTGVKPATVLGAYKVNSVDEMNDAQLVSAISRLKKSKDKA